MLHRHFILVATMLSVTVYGQAPAPQYPPSAAQAMEVIPPPFRFGPRHVARKYETDPLVLRKDTLALSIGFALQRPRLPDAWAATERALFREVAAAGKYDVLVAPVQSDGYALDRISRSLITAQLVGALRERGLRVPNPYTVQRAFGEGRRALGTEVLELGKPLGVDRILAVAASHDRAGKLHLSVTVFEKQRPPADYYLQAGEVRRLPPIDMREGLHPAEVAQAAIPDLLRAAGVSAPVRRSPAKGRSAGVPPESPAAALAASGEKPAELAASLQLMASLASPFAAERARERLYEQALLAALALPDDDPRAAFYRARAWSNLESRTAALRALGRSAQPEAAAYREFLNGNLPGFGAALGKVTDPFARLLLDIDLSSLKQAYGLPEVVTPALIELAKKYPAWSPLVERRLDELNQWSQGDISLPWRMLDRDLPLPGAGPKEQMKGMSAIGRQADSATIAKGTLAHLRRLQREDNLLRQCRDASVYCARGAYLDLMESALVSNLYRVAYLRGVRQKVEDPALDFLQSLEPEFEDHADLLLAKAQILARKAESAPAQQQQASLAAARSAALKAAWIEQGATRTAHQALIYMGVGSWDSLPFLEAYFYDLPVRSYWHLNGGNANLGAAPTRQEIARILGARVDAAVTEIDVAAELHSWTKAGGPDPQRANVLQSRFQGHPRRTEMLALQGGAAPGAAVPAGERLAQLDAAVRERPDHWPNYYALGSYHLIERGDYAAAYKAFMAFPGFKNRQGYNAVALSNHAYAAGSDFFWRGRLEETRPLYRIAAELDTGSAASIASQARLSLMDGDFRAATVLSHMRAQRYSDAYAYRDYLAWLFAFGFRDDAWTGFNQLHDALPNPQVWLAADVGHRIDRRSWPEVRKWLLAEPFRSSAFNRQKHALRLAIMQSSVDRTPARDLVDTLRAIEGQPLVKTEKTADGKGALLAPNAMHDGNMFLRRSQFRLAERQGLKDGEDVASHFVFFADAYVALRRGEYAAAAGKFDAMAAYYPVEGMLGFDPYALAYFAWASARSGDKLGLEAFVRKLNPAQIGFDHHLALAFFSGQKGDHDAALGHLKRAFDARPYTERRPIPTEYQWAEACEWLYEATKERRYLELALPWAKVHQRIQPMMSWAYAFEAKHGTEEQGRIRALGVALYLDPQSERIARVPEKLKSRAREEFAKSNPFDPKREKAGAT
jgi:hypothetical protein